MKEALLTTELSLAPEARVGCWRAPAVEEVVFLIVQDNTAVVVPDYAGFEGSYKTSTCVCYINGVIEGWWTKRRHI